MMNLLLRIVALGVAMSEFTRGQNAARFCDQVTFLFLAVTAWIKRKGDRSAIRSHTAAALWDWQGITFKVSK